jgi:hypothetical protein
MKVYAETHATGTQRLEASAAFTLQRSTGNRDLEGTRYPVNSGCISVTIYQLLQISEQIDANTTITKN